MVRAVRVQLSFLEFLHDTESEEDNTAVQYDFSEDHNTFSGDENLTIERRFVSLLL